MAIRSASGKPELAKLIRKRQDLVTEWQTKSRGLVAARGEAPENRNRKEEQGLSEALTAIDGRLANIDAIIEQEFPELAALTRPASLEEVQATLADDEALILFLDTDARLKHLPEETFTWVVTKTQTIWTHSGLGKTAIDREVAALRCGLDRSSWDADSGQRCASLLNMAGKGSRAKDDPLPFDPARSYDLYKALFGEVEGLIKGKHLLIVGLRRAYAITLPSPSDRSPQKHESFRDRLACPWSRHYCASRGRVVKGAAPYWEPHCSAAPLHRVRESPGRRRPK